MTKNMRFSFFCVLVALATTTTAWSSQQIFGPRRLIVLFDPHAQETSTSQSFAIMSSLIAALEQKAAPILISESLWHNFVIRRFRYDKLKDKHPTGAMIYMELLEKYGPEFAGTDYLSNMKTKEKLQNLYAAHYRYYGQALNVIRTTKGFFDRGAKLRNINIFESELQQDHPFRKDVNFDFICYKTDFNPSEWSVYHIPNFVYLLVPKTYEENIKKNINTQDLPAIPNITQRELILGLKVDHLTKVFNPLNLPDQAVSDSQAETTDKADLSTLFVTRKDFGLFAPTRYIKAPEYYEAYIGAWNVYATGHGSPDKSSSLQETIDTKEKILKKLEQELTDVTNMINKNKSDIKKYEANLKRARTSPDITYYRKAITITQETVQQMEEIQRSQERSLYGLRAELIYLYENLKSGKGGGVIAGLYIDEFKETLSFFNTLIRTGLFFYDTCFSSGKNLEAPYQYEGIPQVYNYTLVSGASVDAPTTVGGANIALPPYTTPARTLFVKTQTRNEQDDFKIDVDQDFAEYFKHLEDYQAGSSSKTLAEILNTIHTFMLAQSLLRLHNVPLVRFPHTSWFRVIDMPKLVASITEQSVITHQIENKPFKLTKQDALLLYTPHISVPVIMEDAHMPAILSMIGGDADHYFEDIRAPKVTLSEIIQKCIAIPGQYFTKQFLIKKLTCVIDKPASYQGFISQRSGDIVTLHDVIIIQNDTKYFTHNSSNKVNAVVFTYRGVSEKETFAHRAIWPKDQKLSSGEIPNLKWISKDEKAQKQLSLVKQAFDLTGKPSKERLEQLQGQERIRTFLEKKAKPVLQEYRTLREINPQAITNWLKTLTPDERKIVNIIAPSEIIVPEPTLTKTQFEAWRKAFEKENKPSAVIKPIGSNKPTTQLTTALQNLQRSLRNLEQQIR